MGLQRKLLRVSYQFCRRAAIGLGLSLQSSVNKERGFANCGRQESGLVSSY